MRKLLLLVLTLVFLSCLHPSLAEEMPPSPYPFGIPEKASYTDVIAFLTSVFGDQLKLGGSIDSGVFKPEDCYFYDFLVDQVSSLGRDADWSLLLSLSEETPDLFADHLLALYAALREWYGDPLSTSPEYTSFDLSGQKTITVLYEDPSALRSQIEKLETEGGEYDCIWPFCTFRLSIHHHRGFSGTITSYGVKLYWGKNNAETEKTAPETAQ